MNVMFVYLIFTLVFQIQPAKPKNILAAFTHSGKSHFIMYKAYLERLAERGHTITLLTWFNETHPLKNIETISYGSQNVPFDFDLARYESMPKFQFIFHELNHLNQLGQESCITGLKNPKIKELIASKPKFDLVIVEYFNTDCFSVFSHIFNAPLLGIFSSPPAPWHNDRMGNPDNPSYIVNLFSGYSSEMTFFQRLKNAFSLLFYKTYYRLYFNGPTDKIIKTNLGKGIPKVGDIVSNTSVFLVNSHHTISQSKPLVPGMVEVGGLHIQQPKKLPKDLEKYLNDSDNGIVYFSFGTVVNETSMPAKKQKIFLTAFGNLTQNVLWKWRDEETFQKPKNLLFKKWLPQNDILAHPNTKIFINHGGWLGIMEAVAYGVPMIIIPLFGDQFHNAALIANKGSAIVLDYFTLTENKLLQALKTILENERYKEKAKLLAAKFKERPVSAMNNAIYWTEYVLKFKGASHLRPANTKLNWCSECLLDILIFTIVALILMIYFGKKAMEVLKEIKKAQAKLKKKKNK